jgi:hypothetical protein
MEDVFTVLAVDSITKQETLVPSPELLKKPDYEPYNGEYMLQSDMRAKWLEGKKEELISIQECKVWRKETLPMGGTKVLLLKWIYKVKKNAFRNVKRYKC